MPKPKGRKEGEQEPIRREYSSCDFDKWVDWALGLDSKKEGKKEQEKQMKLERGIMEETEIELFKLMSEGKWALISEFKYRRPDLREWVDELEYRYWDDHYARMSQWK